MSLNKFAQKDTIGETQQIKNVGTVPFNVNNMLSIWMDSAKVDYEAKVISESVLTGSIQAGHSTLCEAV